eukprot:scaffold40.g5153.t1
MGSQGTGRRNALPLRLQNAPVHLAQHWPAGWIARNYVQRRPTQWRARHTPVLGAAAVAETAAHPKALNSLSVLYLVSCAVERSWRFLFPVALIALSPGDALAALSLLSVASSLATALLGPAVGRALDSVYRPFGLGALLVMQDVCIALKAGVLASLSAGVEVTQLPWRFAVLLACCCFEKLAAIASELEIERDWITRLAGKHNLVTLANSNAFLRRCDLAMELSGAFLFGATTAAFGLLPALGATVALALGAVPLQCGLIGLIARLAPEAMLHGKEDAAAALFKPPAWEWHGFVRRPQRRREQQDGAAAAAAAAGERTTAVASASEAAAATAGGGGAPRPLAARLEEQLAHSMDGWKVYFRQPILPSSLAFVLLFGNIMLAPGNLIVALLDSYGFDSNAHALFRAGCATCGFIGTWAGRQLIQGLGLLRAGCSALGLQVALLGVAVAVYATCMQPAAAALLVPGGGGAPALGAPAVRGVPLPVAAFAACVVLSRIGVWCLDMVNSQLFQQTVPQREMASASSAEMALCSLSEVVMLAVAASSASPSAYPLLVFGSFAAVAAAALLFAAWARAAQPSLDLAIQAAA